MGQFALTAICGVVVIGHVALVEPLTATPQRLFPLPLKVSDTEQLVGAG